MSVLIRSCIHSCKLFRCCSRSLHNQYIIFLSLSIQLKDNAYSKPRLSQIFPFYGRHFLNYSMSQHSLYYLCPLNFPRSLGKFEKFRYISHNVLDLGMQFLCFKAWLHTQCNIYLLYFPL